jgi:aspartyl-tRNA(Asn)/glutamyl-tRNA(Gln) amidotransferase subunit B
LLDQGTLNQTGAKEVLAVMFETGRAPDEIVKEKGLVQISDEEELMRVADEVLDENAGQVAAYLGGKESVLQWFMGQVMRKTRGRAQPQRVQQLLREKLEGRR